MPRSAVSKSEVSIGGTMYYQLVLVQPDMLCCTYSYMGTIYKPAWILDASWQPTAYISFPFPVTYPPNNSHHTYHIAVLIHTI